MADNTHDIQFQFLDSIKQMLPPSKSLVNEISDILEVSTDSAYRRLRGETSLSLDEVAKIARTFKFSLDSLVGAESGSVTFNYLSLKNISDYKSYLESILFELSNLEKAKTKKIRYAANDLPIFHHFRYNKLSAFKTFYWLKSVIGDSDFAAMRFNINIIPAELIDLGKKIYDSYCKISSFEVWTEQSASSTLKQIEYYWEAGVFESEEDALDICNDLREEISYIKRQAEMKSKMLSNDSIQSQHTDNFMLHISDIEIGNNCIQIISENNSAVYLSYHTFNKMRTANEEFSEQTEVWMKGLISRSTLISGVAEKQRYKFFRSIFSKIDKLVMRISDS